MKDFSIKEELYNQCLAFIDNRLITVQNTMHDIQKSLLSETKSSAGDKHETGRAMLQLEREKAGNQLAQIKKVKETLSRIDVEKSSKVIGLGSVVFTTQTNYFIAISAGEIIIDEVLFYAISPSTPIAKLVLSKQSGDAVAFRDRKFTITGVL